MVNNFEKVIEEIYNIILQPIDSMFKTVAINNLKKKLNCNYSISQIYYDSLLSKKEKGIVYTPYKIAELIIQNVLKEEDVINDPYIKIFDPACGTGSILITAYKILYKIYLNNLKEINDKNNLNLNPISIKSHIVRNNLYGMDIDEVALKIFTIELFIESQNIFEKNIYNGDFLFCKDIDKYDIIIGNPPYIGHKSIDRKYYIKLHECFNGVYNDKSDIYYCFMQKAINKCKINGIISLIVPRYFFESQSGENLRKFLLDGCSINKIIDFYGIRPFKNNGIDPCIISFKPIKKSYNSIEIMKPKEAINQKNFIENFNENIALFSKFYVEQENLSSKGWVLWPKEYNDIVDKIKNKCNKVLSDICYSYQGIITGFDKGFIVDDKIIKEHNLEKDIIKPWIKNSNIQKFKVIRNNNYIIYSDMIKNTDDYPNCMKYITMSRDRLEKRRECLSGKLQWYRLQWGRKQQIFEGKKIIFPFKSKDNLFSVDTGSYFSADIYSLVLKEDSLYDYDFLEYILNSKLYTFYFKTFGKKLGGALYEYYPNNFMKLYIPPMDCISIYNENLLMDYFELSEIQKKLIESCI